MTRSRRLLAAAATLIVAAAGTAAVLAWQRDDVPDRTDSAAPGKAAPPKTSAGTATPDRAAYEVTLASDAAGARWTGTEQITFTNTSATPLPEVWLRLWGNGVDGCAGAPVTITGLQGGTAAAPTVGCSAQAVKLGTPLAPGKSTTISFAVTIAAPSEAGRFGSSDGFARFGNALPLLAVHDERGWALQPYVTGGDAFYSLTSDFTVRLTHPTGIQVPATGQVVTATESGGRTTTDIRADDVRDFTWAAGPYRKVTERSGAGVPVTAWSTPADSEQDVAKAVRTAARMLDTFSTAYGKYPWPEIDLVLTGPGSGGMEYPSFVFTETDDFPVTHEVAHQWWYGLVGNDEYAHPWLDEAFAEYSERKYLRGGADRDCAPTFPSPTARIDADMAYFDAHYDEYGKVLYRKGGCMLFDLEKTLGEPAMAELLRGFVADQRFGVATPKEFRDAAQAATKTDLTPLWERWRNTRG